MDFLTIKDEYICIILYMISAVFFILVGVFAAT